MLKSAQSCIATARALPMLIQGPDFGTSLFKNELITKIYSGGGVCRLVVSFV
jgi:hypothetical protein